VLVAALYSPFQALLVLILYIVIPQFENYDAVPRMMSNAVELHPPAVLMALMIGGELLGAVAEQTSRPVPSAPADAQADSLNSSAPNSSAGCPARFCRALAWPRTEVHVYRRVVATRPEHRRCMGT